MLSSVVRAIGLVGVLLSACDRRDIEQSWGVHETRIEHPPDEKAAIDLSAGSLSVTVPLGVPRETLALAASESLVIGADAVIESRDLPPNYAVVASGGTLAIANGASVGTVYDLGQPPLALDPGARLRGYLKAGSAVVVDTKNVAGGVLLSEPAWTEEYRWSVDMGDSLPNRAAIEPADGVAIDVAPGSYGAIRVEVRTTVKLHHGEYRVDALKVSRGGRLELDNTAGPIYVWVARSLELHGELFEYAVRGDILIGYAGTEPVFVDTPLRATLVAPASDITLQTTTREAHTGAVFAKGIVLGAGAHFRLRPFGAATPETSPAPRNICDECYAESTAQVHDCIGNWRHAEWLAASAAGSCEADCAVSLADDDRAACRMMCQADIVRAAPANEVLRARCKQLLKDRYGRCELRGGFRVGTCARIGLSKLD